MRGLKTIIFLIISNTFMTFAWYGHLKFKDYDWGKNLGLISIIFISWGLAFVEYCLAVPANRFGSDVYSAAQLKTMQEVITLLVFAAFSVFYLKQGLTWNHLVGFVFIVIAVFFIFKKW